MKRKHIAIIALAALCLLIGALPLIMAGCAGTQTNLSQDEQNRLIVKAAYMELGNLWTKAVAYKEARHGRFDMEFEKTVRPAYKMTKKAIDEAAEVAKTQSSPIALAEIINSSLSFLRDVLVETGVVQ